MEELNAFEMLIGLGAGLSIFFFGVYEMTLGMREAAADKLRATWAALQFNVILALLITYLLMAALFESFVYPFVILFSVPLATDSALSGWERSQQQRDRLQQLINFAAKPMPAAQWFERRADGSGWPKARCCSTRAITCVPSARRAGIASCRPWRTGST